MKAIHCTIITPERVVYDAEVDQISVHTPNGQISLLPGHEALMTIVAPGDVSIWKNGATTSFVVGQGTLEIHDDQLRILANTTELHSDVDVERAEAALERARNAMEEKAGVYDAEYARLEALIARNLARVKIKRK